MKRFFIIFFIVANLCTLLPTSAWAIVPPKRSTHYNGTNDAYVQFPHEDRYDSNINITIEAWVYRERDDVTETIISHNNWNSIDSFWFGFAGPYLKFYRGGRYLFAESPIKIPTRAWHHVAVTYDGETVRFYMSGLFLGSAPLSNTGANKEYNLTIGGTYGDEHNICSFSGYLDEIRIWSVRRTADELSNNMYLELRDTPGLEAVFPGGGAKEYLPANQFHTGSKGPGAEEEIIGILPRDLVVPRRPKDLNDENPITLDGNVDIQTEYRDAEQMVIRYNLGGDVLDANAYLVYTCGEDDTCNDWDGDEYLYIGIRDLRVEALPSSLVNVNIDPNGSRDGLAQNSDFQIRAFLNEDPAQRLQGDGNGGFYEPECTWLGCPPGNDKWMVAYGGAPEFGSPTIEMRIHVSELGLISDEQEDGITIIHADVGDQHRAYPAPADAVDNSPATWARMTYGESSMPLVTISGHVYDTDSANPKANYTVELGSGNGGAPLHTRITDANGLFSFNGVSMPPGEPIWVRALEVPCVECRFITPVISAGGIQPVSRMPQTVEFPSVDINTNLASVDFIFRHVGPITLTGMDPTSGAQRIVVREDPFKELPPEQITIMGENLHRDIEVYLNQCDLRPFGNAGCNEGVDWLRANIIEFSDDMESIKVEVPDVPRSVGNGAWQWVVKDMWPRPGYEQWRWLDDFFLRQHEYPLVHGFEFDNHRFNPWWQEFDGVFGRNGWIGCIRDPLYEIYFIVFRVWLEESGGSCNGMAATSLRFALEELDPEDDQFDTDETEGVHFASGLARDTDEWRDDFCVPYRPRNLGARIHTYHGVQTSDEYIQTILNQIQEGVFEGDGSITGDPAGVLERVGNHPLEYVISMSPEIGKGHIVTPYAVAPNQDRDGNHEDHISLIWIYDNNFPQEEPPLVRRFIEINSNPDMVRPRYYMPRKTDPTDEDDCWRGDGIFSVPIGVFTRNHTAPGVSTVVQVCHVLIFGDADSNVTSADGEWGWRQDGTLVDNLRGAKAITPTGGPDTSTRCVSLFLPTGNPAPTVTSNVRGPHYWFHAANSGRMFQLEQYNGVNGDRDGFEVSYASKLLDSVRFTPQRRADNFQMRIGMVTGENQRVVVEWNGLDINGGQAVIFRALPDMRGAEFKNDGGSAVNPMYTVTSVDGETATYGKNVFGPFNVPAGASQRITIDDWPTARKLRSEMDLDSNGTYDFTSVAEPSSIITPDSPANLTAAYQASNSVKLVWNDTSSNERGFQIEKKTGDCSAEDEWRQIAFVGADIHEYTDAAVSPAATYSYRVRAYSGYAHSAYTSCVQVTTSLKCEEP